MRERRKTQKKQWKQRQIEDLFSVGPSIRKQLASLGINTVAELARCEPEILYRELCRKARKRQDPCVLDVFRAAVAQARDPLLPPEQCAWWYWSGIRKDSGVRLRNSRTLPV